MKSALLLQTDFGLCDGAVSAMFGVAIGVDPTLRIFNLTHEIPQYNIWDASYRLLQTIQYWPQNTVFVSVVDPGVGTDRLSVIAKTKTNQFIVTPNNGTLTHILEEVGICEVREIDEKTNRLPNSGNSYTFHGRDVYAYAGARLASGVITFEEVGKKISLDQIITIAHNSPKITEDGLILGSIDILDVRFGNLWTNLDRNFIFGKGINYGDNILITIESNHSVVYEKVLKMRQTFAETRCGDALLFINSLDKLGVALNQGSFANAYHIVEGAGWIIKLRKLEGK